ncbi:MAG TPA: hypothetical protein VN258_20675 [Mobilitalea sp.]|nr:hypothetical protein [Mobilitalea sp.]
MSETNPIIRYGEFLIVPINTGKEQGKLWSYHIINISPLMRSSSQRSSAATQLSNSNVSVIVPICNNIKPNRIRHRTANGVESFNTRVGLDQETGIYGIRFDNVNPSHNFVVSFTTPRRKAVDQSIGLFTNGITYKNQVIRSPGCEKA